MTKLPSQHLERLISEIGGIVWESDTKDFVCTYVSEQAEHILGYPVQHWVGDGHSWLEAIHPEDREEVARFAREAIAQGKDFDVDFRAVTFAGRVVWVRAIAHMVRDEGNRVVQMRGLAMDISERKLQEKELILHQRRLANIVASATDAIITIDSHQNITLFNGAAERMFGCHADQVLGKPITQLIPDSFREQHAEWVKAFGQGDVKRRRMGARGEVIGLRSDGTEFTAEASISKVETNGERSYTAILRDITERRRAEDELRASEQRFRAQYKNLPVPTYSWQEQGGKFVLVGYNDAAEEATDGRIGPLLGLKAQEVYSERPDVVESMRQCFEEKRTVRMETGYRFVTTGRQANIEFIFVFVPPDLVLVHANDITERRETEKTLSKLSSAVEQTADSILITDRDGIIEYVNPAFEKMTGFSSAEVLGKKPNILKSDKMDPDIYSKLWETILAGRPFRALFLNCQKNGELYYEDKTIFPLKDARGEITHFVSAGRDKTEQKKAEEQERVLLAAIENAAMEWKLTFDAVESAILVTDRDGNIRRLNRAARDLIRLRYEDVVDRMVQEFAGVEPWQTTAQLLPEVRESRQPASRQIRDAVSGRSWYLNVVQFNHPSHGREMMMITARDVTQIEELQESLRKSETMSAMGSLVAGVAHEVRNPLFSISATLDAFEARFGLRDEYQNYVRTLHQELDRLNALMQELLDYGKPASLNLSDNAIGPIVEEAISACSALASKAEVEIFPSVAPALPKMRCDNGRIAKVFRNLLENAIQHSPKGGRVSVEAHTLREDQETWIECSVKDNGPGFRLEDLPHLFEPFFTRRRGGTGLGLAIVERVVEQHGGKILARNRPEGGAEVLVRLRANGSSRDEESKAWPGTGS